MDRPRRVVDAALPVLQEFTGQLCVISFNPEILAELKGRDKSIPTTLALWTEWQSRISEALDLAQRYGVSAISLADLMILEAPEWVARSHEAGLEVHAYPVSPARDEPEYAKWTPASQEPKWHALREHGVDALLSDFARESVAFCT
jgi:glycerophosphoryl diester phosphodiesterase